MRQAGIAGIHRRRGRGCTRRDPHAEPSSDLVKRNFVVTGPDRLWVMDVTEHRTDEGKVYLACEEERCRILNDGRSAGRTAGRRCFRLTGRPGDRRRSRLRNGGAATSETLIVATGCGRAPALIEAPLRPVSESSVVRRGSDPRRS